MNLAEVLSSSHSDPSPTFHYTELISVGRKQSPRSTLSSSKCGVGVLKCQAFNTMLCGVGSKVSPPSYQVAWMFVIKIAGSSMQSLWTVRCSNIPLLQKPRRWFEMVDWMAIISTAIVVFRKRSLVAVWKIMPRGTFPPPRSSGLHPSPDGRWSTEWKWNHLFSNEIGLEYQATKKQQSFHKVNHKERLVGRKIDYRQVKRRTECAELDPSFIFLSQERTYQIWNHQRVNRWQSIWN